MLRAPRTALLLVLAAALLLAPGAARADIPPDWTAYDIGNAGGSADYVDGVWSMTARGVDIWNRADEFHYVNQYLNGDGSVTARILAQTTTSDPWAKAGVMLRESDAPGSPHVMLVMTPGNGVDLQWRPTLDGDSFNTAPNSYPRVLPLYLRVQRRGDRFSGFVSQDGLTWTQVGSTQPIKMGREILAGLCLTSHHRSRSCTARFDQVQVSDALVPTGPETVQALVRDAAALVLWDAVPGATGYNVYRQAPGGATLVRANRRPIDGLSYVDNGLTNGSIYRYRITAMVEGQETVPSAPVSVTPMAPIQERFYGYTINSTRAGSVSLEADGSISIRGSGRDIWDYEDQFFFLPTLVEGDATITARILGSPTHSDDWAKAGVMIRESLAANARHAMLVATPRNGIAYQWRRTSGGLSDYREAPKPFYPLYLRMVRRGDWLTPFVSLDGLNFEAAGDSLRLEGLERTLWIGLAITAHNEGRTSTARFDRLTVTTP